jgi:hypothetical protein
VNGTAISPLIWSAGQPDNEVNCGGDNNRVAYWNAGQGAPRPLLEDSPEQAFTPCVGLRIGAIIEWSADCNEDGIVDFGQIRAGDLVDLDADNIPDCCESPLGCCPADIDQSGATNGVDLAAILNNWGTSGGKQPRSDVNRDGLVDGSDLAEVLNAWGPCP